MNAAATSQPPLEKLEATKLLLDEWKFRQHHCWQVLERYGLASLALSVAPYTVPELAKTLHGGILVVPLIGWALALWAIWLFGAEYEQCNPVLNTYRALMAPNYPPQEELKGFSAVFDFTIGKVTRLVLVLLMTGLEIVNAMLLWRL